MIISIVNQKGGTGKTTTTINVGKALEDLGYKVLLIDMDPQGNLTYSLAIKRFEFSIKDVLYNKVTISDAVCSREGMDIVPTDIELSFEQFGQDDNFFLLKEAFEINQDYYDFILIDCPPTLSSLTYNALVASRLVLIPMQMDVFSIQGLTQILKTVEDVQERYNAELDIVGVLPTLVDKRKKLTAEVLDHVKEVFDVYIFSTHIRTNVKAAEAPSFGVSVIEYAPESNSAIDYIEATKELVNQLYDNEYSEN